jgi:Caspase domain
VANWAIAIGIDQYWREDACLNGAVRDAKRMAKWFLDPNGGNVPKGNIERLATPRTGEPHPRGWRGATKDDITTAVTDLVERSGAQGERLFFYFAGHGLTVRENYTYEQAIVASDFDDTLKDKTFALSSLWEYFEATEFEDQFFFIDACRDRWPGELVVGRWPSPRTRAPGQQQVQQFRLAATSESLSAAESTTPGHEAGAFTASLLDALAGKGTAKVWCSEGGDYKVRWNRVAGYVTEEFNERLLPAGAGFQVPQATGTQGVLGRPANPVVAKFPPGSFKDERLHVFLAPEAVVRAATVEIVDRDAGDMVQTADQPTRLPVKFRLAPKSYILRARASGYVTAIARPPIEVYGPKPTESNLELALATADAPARAPARARPGQTRAALTVEAPDHLATLEISDATGGIVKTGEGHVEADGLLPGLYRARLRTPEGMLDEQVVALVPGDAETVVVGGMTHEERTPTLDRIVESTGFQAHEDGTLEVSELTGPIASASLATILGLAAGFQARRDKTHGQRLRSLGLTLFESGIPRSAEAGIYVVFGDELKVGAAAARTVQGVELKLWPHGSPVPKEALRLKPATTPGVGEFAKRLRPRPHWLSIRIGGRGRRCVLSLAILPRRAAIVVLHRRTDGVLGVYQYLPAIEPDPSSDPDAIRRIDTLQRVYESGRLDLGHESAEQLLNAKLLDPLAGALGCYLFIRSGRVSELGRAVSNMRRLYPTLSDSHVLRAEFEASRGNAKAAERATREAVAAGVPIFSEGLSRVLDAVEEYRVSEDDKARLLSHVWEHSIRSSLWTLWQPRRIVSGRLLVP